MKRTLQLLLLLILVPSVFGQRGELCRNDDTETIETCWTRFDPPRASQRVAAATEKEEADMTGEMATENTGTPDVDSPLNTSLKDFLTFFTASVETATLTEDQNRLTLDWNARPPGRVDGSPIKLQVVFATPELAANVKSALTGTALTDAEKSLDDLDDVTVRATYAPLTKNLGRGLRPHRQLFQLIVRTARMAEPEPTLALQLVGILQRFANEEPFKSAQNKREVKIKDLTPVQRAAVEAPLVAAARQASEISATYRQAAQALGIDEFRKLLGAQPQLYFTGSRRQRNELAGANEMAVRATFEWGGRSLKNFYKTAGDTCDLDDLDAAASDAESRAGKDCMAAFRSFIRSAETRNAMASTGRGAISLEYSGIGENDVHLATAAPAVDLHTDDSESLIVTGTYGWMMNQTPGREGRFDFNASYENVTGDADRDNRFEVSAVYTQKLTDSFTLPLGIVYANQDRYLKDVTRQVSMHFGLVYKLPDLSNAFGRGQ